MLGSVLDPTNLKIKLVGSVRSELPALERSVFQVCALTNFVPPPRELRECGCGPTNSTSQKHVTTMF